MKHLAALAILALSANAADPLAERADHKLDLIQQNKIPRGATVNFSKAEINAWARFKVPQIVPEGMRDPRVELGEQTATGYTLADFLKMRQAKGQATNWFMTRLLEGERPLIVSVRLESGAGRCIVHLTRVQISGASANSTVLDFLIKTFFLPLYPDAKIDEPFDLDYGIDRIEIHPSGAAVIMKK